ncbi:MAG: ABC transporter substrate-binding protein [Actinomycetota bacterium]
MTRHWKRLLIALLALTLFAAACGDSDDDADDGDEAVAADDAGGDDEGGDEGGDTADTEAAEPAETTCEALDEVSLQLQWVTQSQFAGYYAAVDQGFFESFCLDVEIVEGGVDIVPQQQLGSGAVDFAISWVPRALVSREEGIDIVNVGQVFQRSGTLQVAFADSGITEPADFAGRQIGNWGFGNEFELVAGARQAGLEPGEDFEFVQQNFDMFALISGEIDAAQAMIYNEYAQVLETIDEETGELYQPEDLVIIDWNEQGTAMLQDAIWADAARLASDEAYADITTRFIAGAVEGWAWCRDNIEPCVDVVLDNSPILGRSHMTWQLNEINNLIWPSPGGAAVMDQGLWDQTIDIATSLEVLSAPPDEGAFTTEFAEAALALLEAKGVDVTGESWTPIEVELLEGGE